MSDIGSSAANSNMELSEWDLAPAMLFQTNVLVEDVPVNPREVRRATSAPSVLVNAPTDDLDGMDAIPQSELYRCTAEYAKLYFSTVPRDPRMAPPIRVTARKAAVHAQAAMPPPSMIAPFPAMNHSLLNRQLPLSPGQQQTNNHSLQSNNNKSISNSEMQSHSHMLTPSGGMIAMASESSTTTVPMWTTASPPLPHDGSNVVYLTAAPGTAPPPPPQMTYMIVTAAPPPPPPPQPGTITTVVVEQQTAHPTTILMTTPPPPPQPPTSAVVLSEYIANKRGGEWNHIDRIRGHVPTFCKDQDGSRLVQRLLDSPGNDVIVFEELRGAGPLQEMVVDVFGNYVVQKLVDVASLEIIHGLMLQIRHKLLEMSQHTYGCRVIQKVLDRSRAPEHLRWLGDALTDAAVECVKDQNANHVIQKMIDAHPSWCPRLLSQIMNKLDEVSCHPYGCRVMQRLFEQFTYLQGIPVTPYQDLPATSNNASPLVPNNRGVRGRGGQAGGGGMRGAPPNARNGAGTTMAQPISTIPESHRRIVDLLPVLEAVRLRAEEYVLNQYGNYVVQHGMLNAPPDLRAAFIDRLLPTIGTLSGSKFASNVAEKVVEIASEAQRTEAVRLLCRGSPPAVASMMQDPFANYVVQRLLEHGNTPQRQSIVDAIIPWISTVATSTYGRHLLSRIEKLGFTLPPTSGQSAHHNSNSSSGRGDALYGDHQGYYNHGNKASYNNSNNQGPHRSYHQEGSNNYGPPSGGYHQPPPPPPARQQHSAGSYHNNHMNAAPPPAPPQHHFHQQQHHTPTPYAAAPPPQPPQSHSTTTTTYHIYSPPGSFPPGPTTQQPLLPPPTHHHHHHTPPTAPTTTTTTYYYTQPAGAPPPPVEQHPTSSSWFQPAPAATYFTAYPQPSYTYHAS